MKRFGIATNGLEQYFEDIFKNYFLNYKGEEFSYLEIGAAGCLSLKSFYEIIKENFNKKVDVVGLDLTNGWSLEWNQIQAFGHPLSIIEKGKLVNGINSDVKLILEDDPRLWISNYYKNESLDICFIDGCHGSKCVTKDFNTVSSKIKKNGIVFFHDSGKSETGTDWQHHCEEFINVRKAILDLGLDGSNKDWKFINDIEGSRARGSDGNGLWIIQKI
jgi:hypothetical protein